MLVHDFLKDGIISGGCPKPFFASCHHRPSRVLASKVHLHSLQLQIDDDSGLPIESFRVPFIEHRSLHWHRWRRRRRGDFDRRASRQDDKTATQSESPTENHHAHIAARAQWWMPPLIQAKKMRRLSCAGRSSYGRAAIPGVAAETQQSGRLWSYQTTSREFRKAPHVKPLPGPLEQT
jgi:hypothetical protein